MSSAVDETSEATDSHKLSDTFTETINQEDRNVERKIGGSEQRGGEETPRRPILERSLGVPNDERPTLRPRVNVETGYLTKTPRNNRSVEKAEVKMEVEVPIMSHMEREAMQERTRMTLLRQMTDYLSSDGSSRYTKDTFRRVFTEKVGSF